MANTSRQKERKGNTKVKRKERARKAGRKSGEVRQAREGNVDVLGDGMRDESPDRAGIVEDVSPHNSPTREGIVTPDASPRRPTFEVDFSPRRIFKADSASGSGLCESASGGIVT